MGFLTQVVIDEVGCEGRLLVFPASVHASVGVRCVHRENISADAHQFCLSHQLPNSGGTRGQGSWQLFSGHPRLRSGVPGQLCLRPVLLQAGGDTSLQL